MYTKNCQNNLKQQWSINSTMELIENKPKELTHSYKVWKNSILRSKTDLSQSSKWRAFLSLQRHHMTQCGTIRQTTIFRVSPKLTCQPAQRCSTWQGITQDTPNKPNTIDHSSLAKEQCSKRWSTLSPLCLHKQHQSITIRLRFRKLSIVKRFPKAAVQEKKAIRGCPREEKIPFEYFL